MALRSAAASDPLLRQTSLDRHREMVESYAELYRTLMHVFGLRPKPPFTWWQSPARSDCYGVANVYWTAVTAKTIWGYF